MLPSHSYGMLINGQLINEVDKSQIGVKRFNDSIEFINSDLSKISSEVIVIPSHPDWPQGFDADFNYKILSHKKSLLLYILQITHLLASTQRVVIPLDFQALMHQNLKSQFPIQILITSLALLFKLSIPIKTLCIEFKVLNGESEHIEKLVKIRLIELIRQVEKVFNVPPMVIKINDGDITSVKVETTPIINIINHLKKSYNDNLVGQSPALNLYRKQLNQIEIQLIEEFQNEIEKLGLDSLGDNLQNLVYKFQNQFISLGLSIAPKNVNFHSMLQVVHQNFTNRLKSVADGMLAYAILQGGYYPKHSILKSGVGEMMSITGRIFPFWLIKLIRKLKIPLTFKFNYLSPDAFGFSNYFQSSYKSISPDRINYYSTVDNI